MIDSGTKCKLGTSCGLVRGNLQSPGTLGLSSESKISWMNFLVGLKVQSTHGDLSIQNQIFIMYNK